MTTKNKRIHRRVGRHGGVAVGVALLAGLLVLAGCSASEDTAGSSADMPQRDVAGAAAPGPDGRPEGGAADDGADGGGSAPQEAAAGAGDRGGNAGPDAASPVDLRVGERSIIYSGSITVEVTDVAGKASEAATIASSVGGFVGRDQRSEYDDQGRATLELRVPAAEFDRVVDRLSRLGEELSRELSVQDVTEEVIDLDARITTQEARVRSGRALLAQAETLADLVMLEGELAKREADLASLQARKRGLADLVTLSRITVELVGPGTPPTAQEPQTGFLAGLAAGWGAFTASVRILVTVFGALLPWLVALGVPVLGLLWVLRTRRRRAESAQTGPALPAAVGATGPAAQATTATTSAAPPAPRPAAEESTPTSG